EPHGDAGARRESGCQNSRRQGGARLDWRSSATPGEEPLAKPSAVGLLGLELPAELPRKGFLVSDVLVPSPPVTKVIGHRRIDIDQVEGGIAVCDLLRRGSLVEGVNHRFKRYTGLANPDGSVTAGAERRGIGFERQCHGSSSSPGALKQTKYTNRED